MSWRYMPARQTIDGEELWTVREVYDGTSWTANGIAPTADSFEGLLDVLRMMTRDMERMLALEDRYVLHPFVDLDAEHVAERPFR
ncbi:MAG: hypothetical protein ACOH10_07900 [Rhodoglobus sp.]